MRVKTSQAVVEALKKEDVRYVFGLPGGHSVEVLYDALYDEPGIKAILSRHEESGAFEAYGYAQITNQVGLCHGTAGPGWGQLLPGVHEAYASRTPLIALVAAVPLKYRGMGALQEFPQKESMIPFCKWRYTVDMPEKVPWVMRRAFSIARSPPPGPVFVEIPIDVGQAEFEMGEEYRPAPVSRCAGDPARVREASEQLLRADSPVIIAGRGIHQSAAWTELRDLAELLAIPVITTNSGKGAIPENHPLSAGGIAINMTKVSEKVYNEADTLFFIGTQLEEWATAMWQWLPAGAKMIYSDADPAQMSRNWIPDIAIVGDAKLILHQILDYCRRKVQKPGQEHPRVKSIVKLKEEYQKEVDDLNRIEKVPMHPVRLILALNKLMEDDAIAVLGEGQNRVWMGTYLQVRTAGHWISASDYGCMGLSVSASIGVKLGKPDNQVFCVTGDGSFQMQMHELPVAQEYDAPVTWFVADDKSLGWIKWWQREFKGGRVYAVDYEKTWRYDKVAEACGAEGILVERPAELEEAIERAFKANEEGRSVVVDVIIDTVDHPYGSSKYHDLFR